MPQMIFVNLPVRDLPRSIAFYEAQGFSKNDAFSDERAACIVVSQTIFLMLLTHERFADFTPKAIPDAKVHAQMLVALSQDSREAVDAAVDRAVAAGGTADPTPRQDYGFMYGRSFEDPDGHILEVMWMDPAAAADGPPQT